MPSQHESMVDVSGTPLLDWQYGVSVTLSRGNDSTAAFTARRNDLVYESVGADFGLQIKVTMRDYLLPTEKVVLNANELEPRVGDRVTEGSEVFEIAPIDETRPAVELQSGGFDWLVHTKKVA